MSGADTTCWTMIRGAARGAEADRRAFVDRYVGVVRAYLGSRWRGGPLGQEVDDAVQEVFVECFKAGGALEKLDPERGRDFRAFLFGIVRNVARRIETRGASRREGQAPSGFFTGGASPDDDAALTRVFDRAWAHSVMREAAATQRRRADDDDARRRVELLRLRFQEGLPVRDIARLWEADAAKLHHDYARARAEFRAILEEVVGQYLPGPDVEQECAFLLRALG
ncbi:MAG: RNA polymerase sigma factor [Planctomycetota bacterium]|jgi:RNA polymerase sigma-70 factor (ECF subfamily)